jgi:hypothetical protein
MKTSGKQAQNAPAKATPRAARATAPAARDATGLLELQRAVGNRAVRSLLSAPGVVQRRAIPGAAASATPQATAARGTGGAGGPLPYLQQIQASFGRHDVSRVKAFSGGAAASAAGELGAQAFAYGDRVAFASRPDLRTAAHEAAHVVQQRSGAHPMGGLDRPGDRFERHADAVADAVVAGRSAERLLDALGGGRSTAASVQRQPRRAKPAGKDDDPMAAWHSPKDALLVVSDDKRVFILPAHGVAYVPTDAALASGAWMKTFVDRDLGVLLSAPAIGAAGTRLTKIGNNTAMVFDAGFSTTGTSSAVFINQLQAALNNIGAGEVSQLRILHVHADHVNQIPALVRAHPNVQVIVPEAFVRGPVFPALQRAINEVRNDPQLRADARFGPNWSPTAPKDKGGPAVSVLRFSAGEYVIEQIGLRSALRNVAAQPDLASYITKITRTSDRASAVIIGDPRFVDLIEFRTEMERWRPGMWTNFWEGVTTVSGFSHHFGRMQDRDIPGFIALMEATYFRTGRLKVIEQTNTVSGSAQQTRQQTIEFARNLGVDITVTDMPAPGAAPSAASVTRDTVAATGPSASTPAPITSAFTDGVARLRRLLLARETMQTWRPLVDARGPDDKAAVDREIAQVEQSITDLRTRLSTASQQMARVRTGGTVTGRGLRDYSAAGGDRGRDYQIALTALTPPTAAERSLGQEGFRVLEELRNRKPSEMPARIAIERAFRTGVYSDEAFRAMLAQIDPATRDSLLYGPRGQALPKNVKFQRLATAYATQSMLPDGSIASSAHLTGARGRVARGAGWALLISEGLNLYGEIRESMRTSKETNIRRNLLPFVGRMQFWQTLGVQVQDKELAVVGVDDDLTDWSPTYVRDYQKIIDGLNDGSLDAFFIEDTKERPCFSQMAYLHMAARLSFYVRNEEEFTSLFLNSGQTAVKWEPYDGNWASANWFVRVAEYNTTGINSVDERWVYDEMLTKVMQKVAARVIDNTKKLLQRQFDGKPLPDEESETGTLLADAPPRGAKKARLYGSVDERTVYTERIRGGNPRGGGERISRTAKFWSPPVFYVHEQIGGYTMVTGADYNTYAVLRRLSYEHAELHADSRGTHEVVHLVANEEAWVWIPTWLLRIDP